MVKNIGILSCGALMFPLSILSAKIMKVDLFGFSAVKCNYRSHYSRGRSADFIVCSQKRNETIYTMKNSENLLQ